MRFASFRVLFFGSQRCRDTFSHIATFPAATADRARNTPLTPIGKCRALGKYRSEVDTYEPLFEAPESEPPAEEGAENMKEHPRTNGAERALLGTCQAGWFSRVPGRRIDRDVST